MSGSTLDNSPMISYARKAYLYYKNRGARNVNFINEYIDTNVPEQLKGQVLAIVYHAFRYEEEFIKKHKTWIKLHKHLENYTVGIERK